jgi:hypothetical protein
MSAVNSIKELHDLLNTIENEPNDDTKACTVALNNSVTRAY